MTFSEFLDRWKASSGAERADKDQFRGELCTVLGVEPPRPTTGDPERDAYVFEKDVDIAHEDEKKTIGKIDLYKHGFFLLEAKQESKALSKKLGTGAAEYVGLEHRRMRSRRRSGMRGLSSTLYRR